jgi:hypothetical protein
MGAQRGQSRCSDEGSVYRPSSPHEECICKNPVTDLELFTTLGKK